MNDPEITRRYQRAGLGGAVPRGDRPGIVVVDFSSGFTDPAFPLGGDCAAEIANTKRLLDVAREVGLPIFFTTIGYEPDGSDCGLWPVKGLHLPALALGTRWVEIDERLGRREGEAVIVKKGASGFFGTNLASLLIAQRVDTVVLCGATTSGCVRATAIDLMQYAWPALIPRECVADRAPGPHEASLFDIQAKYGDVIGLDAALDYLDSRPRIGSSGRVQEASGVTDR